MKIGDPISLVESSLPAPQRPRLKPCPFCGKEPDYDTVRESVTIPGCFWPEQVKCVKCNITFRSGENGVENAPAHWNKRV